jgi:hypothetical protein
MATIDKPKAPVNDSILFALARLIDDAQSERRDPSHSDIDFQINQAKLTAGDPKAQGLTVGKATHRQLHRLPVCLHDTQPGQGSVKRRLQPSQIFCIPRRYENYDMQRTGRAM